MHDDSKILNDRVLCFFVAHITNKVVNKKTSNFNLNSMAAKVAFFTPFLFFLFLKN